MMQQRSVRVYLDSRPADRSRISRQAHSDTPSGRAAFIAPPSQKTTRPIQTRLNYDYLRTPVVQRNIDSTGFETSADNTPLYMVDSASRETLYSTTDAPAPKPTGLYAKRADHDDADGKQVYVWTPNVRLLSND